MMSLRRRALFFAGLFVAVSCSDAGNPLEPRGPEPGPTSPEEAMQTLQCSVNVATRIMQCGPEQPNTGAALGSGSLQTGGQNVYVTLANTPPVRTGAADGERDTLTMNVTVKNLIPQALGTLDGTSADAQGVRVFFFQEPVGMPTGEAVVANASGEAAFTSALPQPYFQYNGLLEPDETSEATPWAFAFDESVTTFNFKVLVWAMVKHENGWADITPKGDTIAPGETTALTATVRRKNGTIHPNPNHQNVTWSSSDNAVATVDASGVVTGVGAGTAQITATPEFPPYAAGSVTIVVNSPVQAVTDSVDALGNVTISYPESIGLLANDSDADPSQTMWVIPGTVATAEGGTAEIDSTGAFTYLSFPGFIGKDTIPYTVTDGVEQDEGVAIVNVGQRYWYVQPSAASNGTGTDASPFNTLAAAGPVSSGTDVILVLGGGNPSAPDAGITLDNGQHLIGQGIASDLTTTLMAGVVSVTLLDGTGVSPKVAGTVTVGQNNTIRGVQIDAASGAAIAGTGFGTLAISEQVILNPSAGPALNLNNGTLNSADVFSLSSTSSTSTGLSLTNVSGSLTANGGAITGATGAGIEVNGGTVSLTYGGNVTQGSNAPLLTVTGSHATGTLTFNGTLSATAGDGLQFNAAGGTYNFNGTTTLNGGNAGVDITNGSAGTFSFGTGTGITSPTGSAFTVYGSSPVVTYSGNITKGNAGLLVEIGEQPGGSVTFNTGTLQASAGDGISLSNADGANSFNGTTTLNGGDAGVDVVSQSSGAIVFGSGASIGNASGIALRVANGGASTNVSFAGGITSSATGLAAHVEGVSAGSVTASGSVSGANGILVQNNTGGTITFSGAKTLNTGANAAVTLTNNPGAAINLTGGALGITTGAGAGILGNGAGGFGSLTVNNATVNANGPALNLTNGTLNGTFSSLTSTNSATSGVTLTTVNGTLNTSGGSITGAAGTAFNVSGGNLAGTIATGISQGNNASLLAVAGGHNTGTLTFSGNVSATNGNGVQFTDADGTYTFTGTFSLNGSGDEGIDIAAASTGTVNVTPAGGNTAEIVSPSGIAISIAGGSLSYSGTVTQATSGVALLSVSGGAGGHSGTVTFPSGTLTATNGSGLQFDNADGTYTFGGTVALSNSVLGADAGIDITNGSGGTFTFPTAASITNPIGSLITILNSAPNFTYSGGLTKNNTSATAILAQSNTGGTITFNGDATSADGDPADVARVINTGSAPGVSLVSNTGATFNFNGGGLAITTTTGMGFNATSGGTINVTGAGNVISSGVGTALNVQNTTIGASGLSFLSISHSGGANGIVLQNTGNTNGMQVTGNGGVCTVATPTCTGGVIQGTSGDGVSLNSVTNVSLSLMRVQTAGGSGIYGSSVTGFKLKNGLVNSNGNAVGEAGVEFDGLFGTDSIFNSTVTGSAEDNVVVRNTSGTLDSLVVISSTFSSNSSIGSDGILVTASNAANATVRVRNSTFTANKGDHFQATASNTANMNVVLSQNTMTGGHPTALGQGITLTNGLSHSGTFTYDINSNNIPSGPISNAITVAQDGTTGAVMQGRIRNNVIGTSGSALSCSTQGTGIRVDLSNRGTHTTAVTGNTVRRCFDRGIFFDAGDGTNATFNITATGNIVDQQDDAGARDGMRIEAGAFDPNFLALRDKFTLCAVVGGAAAADKNVLDVGPGGGNPLRARLRFDSRMNMPGYAGPNHNPAGEVEAYLAARNTYVAGSGSATTTAASGDAFGFGNAASCPTPP